MKKVKIYSFEVCPYCIQAKLLLDAMKIDYTEVMLSREELVEFSKTTKMSTVPQIFIEEELIGGFSELSELVKSGKFQEMI